MRFFQFGGSRPAELKLAEGVREGRTIPGKATGGSIPTGSRRAQARVRNVPINAAAIHRARALVLPVQGAGRRDEIMRLRSEESHA